MSSFKMKLTQIKPHIYYLLFDTQYELCSTMLRIEEFYESPYKNIKGKYFTLETYMDTYAKDTGNFTYYSDWNGYNIPSDSINEFWKTFNNYPVEPLLNSLLEKEKKLYDILTGISDPKYYLIATHKKVVKSALNHELAHAYYYLDPDYKKAMDDLIGGFKHRKAMETKLLKMGYGKSVLSDEIQAYLSTTKRYDIDSKIMNRDWKIPEEFRKIFRERDKKD